jgi:hypothetical protein
MSGAGFRTFVDGDVLTASQVNTFLMSQAVMVFDDATDRATQLGGSVSEGMVSYRKDGDVLEVYDGSNWIALDDPNAIQNSIVDAKGDIITATADNTPARLAVGTNEHRLVADSSTSTGLKYVADTTNYAVAAKGDLLAGTAADTLAALTVGTNGQVLTADSSTSTGLAWATPATPAGGKVLQVVQATHATQVTITGTTYTDSGLSCTITPSVNTSKVLVFVSQGLYTEDNTDGVVAAAVRLMRDSTAVWAMDDGSIFRAIAQAMGTSPAAGDKNIGRWSGMTYLDSPTTTQAVTYKTQGKLENTTGAPQLRFQYGSSTSVMVLLEIGA